MKDDNRKRISHYEHWPRKRGQSCPELLVLILLVTILSVAFLPMMNKRYVVKAQYAGDGIPVVGNLRVKAGLYQYEKHRLPGLGLNADGTVAETSQLGDGLSRVQTFSGTEPAAWTADFSKIVAVTNVNHFARDLDVHYADLTGRRLHPQHVQYRVDGCETNRYAYVVGVFGDGEGLKAGTGYAVMEVVNGATEVKEVMRWERYRPVAKRPNQIVMVNAVEAKRYFGCESAEQAREMNICWVGDTEALMSGDKKQVEKALKELNVAGWEF